MTTPTRRRVPPGMELLPWDKMRRNPATRQSEPSIDLLALLRLEIGKRRRGVLPFNDAIMYAALRIAERGGIKALMDEIELIEKEDHLQHIDPPRLRKARRGAAEAETE